MFQDLNKTNSLQLLYPDNQSIIPKSSKFEWSFNEIIYFIKKNYIQIGMILLVFIILIVVEQITFLNAAFAISPVIIPGSSQNSAPTKKKKKN
jgi:hypothetical protein